MLTSYIGALQTLLDYNKAVETGYAKYRGGMFKISAMDHWIVIVSGPELLLEYSRTREEDLSLGSATSKVTATMYPYQKIDDEPDRLFKDLIRWEWAKTAGRMISIGVLFGMQ